jgi:colicin import membrane protein
MKKFQEPPFKQNAIALGFTLGVHIVAIVGLLYLGMGKPPEQPKKITTILVKPEDLPPPMAKPVEQQTTAENQAEEILSPIVDETQPENLPVAPPPPTAQQLAAEKQKAEQAQQAKLALEIFS